MNNISRTCSYIDFLDASDYVLSDIAPLIENINVVISLSSLNDHLLRRDFGTIMESPELFWQAFCKALSLTQKEKSGLYSLTVSGDLLTLSGVKTGISLANRYKNDHLNTLRDHFLSKCIPDQKNLIRV